MSIFLNSLEKFSEEYNISKIDKLKFLLHYPVFKANWHLNYGQGVKQKISKAVYKGLDKHQFVIKACKNNNRVSIPISFENSDLASFREVFWGEEYGEIIKQQNIKTVFDVGANTGMASLYFLLNFELEKIVLVEANPALYKKLSFLDDQQKVAVENLAVHSKDGESLNFKITDNHRDSHIVDSDKGDDIIKVDTIKLQSLMKKHNLDSVDLLKMDIEGAEFDLLENDFESFRLFKYICMEIHGEDTKRADFRDKLCSSGFNIISTTTEPGYDCEISFFKKI